MAKRLESELRMESLRATDLRSWTFVIFGFLGFIPVYGSNEAHR